MMIQLQGNFISAEDNTIRKVFSFDFNHICMSLIPGKKSTKCFISECKHKAEFVINQKGKAIQLCKTHYVIHQNKDKSYEAGFSKASSL